MIGQIIDKYRLVEEIGQGGMAIVYRAHDSKLKRDVAIKLLLPHLLRQPESVKRFQREAVTVASLSHPNIIDIYDYSGDQSPQPYIVTELIEGVTLARFIDDNGPLPCELAACIAREICLALEHAHGQGIIHRDLKPENIMIRHDGKIKLMDFGIARVLESVTMTLTGSIMGSPAFMSPEQITGQPVAVTSDLFSLGSILYFMACGRAPFEGRNPHELIKRVVDGERLPCQMVAPKVSNRYDRIVESLLSKQPQARPQSAQHVMSELEKVIKHGGILSPGEEMHHLFSDPPAYIAQFWKKLASHLEQQAAQQRKRKPALAMQTYSRLLAIEPDHPIAARQLDRLISRKRSFARTRIEASVGIALLFLTVLLAWGVDRYDPIAELYKELENGPPETLASFAPIDDQTPADLVHKAPENEIPNISGPLVTTRNASGQVRISPSNAATRAQNRTQAPKPDGPPPFGSLKVVALPWADIYINGRMVGTSPHVQPIELAAGKNEIRLENPSYMPFTRVIEVDRANQREFIRHRMERLPGLLKLQNDQQAMLFIDGKFMGYTPSAKPIPIKLSEQESERVILVSLTKAGFTPFNQRLTIKAGQTETLTVALKPKADEP
jgi:serine/threonine-protein kinase